MREEIKQKSSAGYNASLSGTFKFDPRRYHLLSIGINAYEDKDIPNLRTAEGDACFFADTLIQECGFPDENVKCLIGKEATWERINSALQGYIDELTEHDALVIYYAGHGEKDSHADVGSWLPVDTQIGRLNTRFSHDHLRSRVRNIRARHVAIVSDSCFAGLLTRAIQGSKSIERGVNWCLDAWQHRSRTALTSGDDHPVGDDGPGGHSLFCQLVCDFVRTTRRNVFTLGDVGSAIREKISGQRVSYGSLKSDGHDNGELVFCRPESNARPIIAETDEPEEVVEYTVETIQIRVESVVPTDAELSTELPPLPKGIHRWRGELAGLSKTLEQLQSGTHPALEKTHKVEADAKIQYNNQIAVRNQCWQELSVSLRDEMKQAFSQNPERVITDFISQCPEGMVLPGFLKAVVAIRRAEQSKIVLDRVKRQAELSISEEIKQLEVRRQDAARKIIDSTIISFLKYHKVWGKEGSFPEEEFIPLLELLSTYNTGMSDAIILQRGRQLLTEESPWAKNLEKEEKKVRERERREDEEAKRKIAKAKQRAKVVERIQKVDTAMHNYLFPISRNISGASFSGLLSGLFVFILCAGLIIGCIGFYKVYFVNRAVRSMESKKLRAPLLTSLPQGGDQMAIKWEVVNSRWVRNHYADGAITMSDKATGLMWVYDADENDKAFWNAANDRCETLHYAGYDDWFLPDKDQLTALYMHKDLFKDVRDNIWRSFPGAPAYWTSTASYDEFLREYDEQYKCTVKMADNGNTGEGWFEGVNHWIWPCRKQK